ncbi:MAG: DNA primase family protein [Ktedonobacteraceae bacterium]
MNNVARSRTNVKSTTQNSTKDQPRNLYLVPALAEYTPSTALTEAGNATRLLERHGSDMRYVPAWKEWLVWNGQKWERDERGLSWLFAEDTLKNLYRTAGETESSDERKALAKFALSCESEKKIKSMLTMATKRPGVPVLPAELDADPWTFNVANGTINLVNGTFQPAKQEDLCTKQSQVEYQASAACPNWLAFLNKIMADNQQLISFIQRVIGYALTGKTGEQAMFILWGSGANGKSTLLDVIAKLLDEYGMNTPASTLLAKSKNDTQSYDLARLAGVRFVAASETDQDKKLAEGTIKSLTGDKSITARLLYGNPFTFNPIMKLFLATNNKPQISGKDEGIWRRVKLIPFKVTIPPEERDKDLYDKLVAELPGILNWAIQGCLDWQQQGLNEPEEVVLAIQEYRNEQDIMAQFLEEECTLTPTASCTAKELYAHYCQWCEENGEKPDSQKRFGGTLLRISGIDKYKSGTINYSGIKPGKDEYLTTPPPDDEKKNTRVGVPDEVISNLGRLDDLDDSSETSTRSETLAQSLPNTVQMVQSSNIPNDLAMFEPGQYVQTPQGRGRVERVSAIGIYISVDGGTKRYSTTAQIALLDILPGA